MSVFEEKLSLLIKIVTCDSSKVKNLIEIVCRSINGDAQVTLKGILVNFVPVNWLMMKIRCNGTIEYPLLLIENETSTFEQMHESEGPAVVWEQSNR